MTEMEKNLVALHHQAQDARRHAIELYRLTGKVANRADSGDVRQPEYSAAKRLREAIRPYMIDLLDVELALLDGEMVGPFLKEE